MTLEIVEENNKIKNSLCKFLSDKNVPYLPATQKNSTKIYIDFPSSALLHLTINNTENKKASHDCQLYMFNSDEKNTARLSKNALIISYGLNSIATVTASSIDSGDDFLCFQYCLQRGILSFSGKKIEPMEFPVKLSNTEIDIHSALAVVTFTLMYDF